MKISETQLEVFLLEYLKKFNELASIFSEVWKQKIFPSFFIKPYEIIETISNVYGIAIEFVRE